MLVTFVQFIIFSRMKRTYHDHLKKMSEDYKNVYKDNIHKLVSIRKYNYGVGRLDDEVFSLFKNQDESWLKDVEHLLNRYVRREALYDLLIYLLFLTGISLTIRHVDAMYHLGLAILSILILFFFAGLYPISRATFTLQVIEELRNNRLLYGYDHMFSELRLSSDYIDDKKFYETCDEKKYIINSLSTILAINLVMVGIGIFFLF